MARQKISQYTKIKDDPSTTQSNAGMRTTFIRLVDDITFISDTEIKKFCKEEQNQDYNIVHYSFLYIQ